MTNKIIKKLPKEFVVTRKNKVTFYKFMPSSAFPTLIHFKKLTIDSYDLTILGVINTATELNHTKELLEAFSLGIVVPDGTWDKHVEAITECIKNITGKPKFVKDK